MGQGNVWVRPVTGPSFSRPRNFFYLSCKQPSPYNIISWTTQSDDFKRSWKTSTTKPNSFLNLFRPFLLFFDVFFFPEWHFIIDYCTLAYIGELLSKYKVFIIELFLWYKNATESKITKMECIAVYIRRQINSFWKYIWSIGIWWRKVKERENYIFVICISGYQALYVALQIIYRFTLCIPYHNLSAKILTRLFFFFFKSKMLTWGAKSKAIGSMWYKLKNLY